MDVILTVIKKKMHVFYITLDGSVPAIADVIDMFPFTVYGVDMRDVAPRDVPLSVMSLGSQLSLRRGRDRHEDLPSMGALGCSLSHYQCWTHIVQADLEYAFIFERDATLGGQPFNSVYSYVQKQLHDGFDYVSLGYDRQPAIFPTRVRPSRLHSFIRTHAQVVTQKGARTLLRHFFPIEMQVDGYIGALSRVGLLRACGRRLFTQRMQNGSTTHKITDVLNFKTHCPRQLEQWIILALVIAIVHLTIY